MINQDDFPVGSLEYEAGRIPQCFTRNWFGEELIENLLEYFSSDIKFDEAKIKSKGLVLICASTDGQMEDSDDELFAKLFDLFDLGKLYATSVFELKRAKQGSVLTAIIEKPSGADMCALRSGFWCASNWIPILKEKIFHGILGEKGFTLI